MELAIQNWVKGDKEIKELSDIVKIIFKLKAALVTKRSSLCSSLVVSLLSTHYLDSCVLPQLSTLSKF